MPSVFCGIYMRTRLLPEDLQFATFESPKKKGKPYFGKHLDSIAYTLVASVKHEHTVTRSFRISEAALRAIEEESQRHNVSVSTILNQQLLAYAEFERFVKRLGLVKISSSTFRRILSAGPDSEIAQAGIEAGGDIPASIIVAKNGSLSLQTVIGHLNSLSEYAGLFEYGETDSEGNKVITLLHRLGPKGSIFFANYAKALFGGIGFSPKITSTEHSVVIEVTLRRGEQGGIASL